MTLTPQITTLIDKVDTSEVIIDQIAAILVIEQANQQTLATAASKDPRLWALRVFVGRANPWAEFIDSPDQLNATPIVNVDFDSSIYDKSASDTFERQRTSALYNIDCYGYGVSATSGAGHAPGDQVAGDEAMRAGRLVRNILMSSFYTYLGLQRGTIARRWPEQYQSFQPSNGQQPVQNVMAVRLQLRVDFNEFSPQVVAEIMDTIALTVKRGENGAVYFNETIPIP